VFLISKAREMEDFSRNNMAMVKAYKQNLPPILNF
jgi:hypothetical protein